MTRHGNPYERPLADVRFPLLACDVCGAVGSAGVAAMPGVPASFSYCPDCLRADAHPYAMVVTNTALCGGMEAVAGWWEQVVEHTLYHLELTREQFDADVALEITQFAESDR